MAGFDADKLGERLDKLNRGKLAAIEKLSEDVLEEMQRKGPIRAGDDEAGAAGKGANKPSRQRRTPR